MSETHPLENGYRLRAANPGDFPFALDGMEESVLASVSEEEARRSEDWMDFFRGLVSVHFEGAGMRNFLLILENEEDSAGMLWLGVGADQFTGEDCGYVLGIQVEPAHRGRGLGGMMLRWAEGWFQEEGLKYMSINVSPRNVHAKELYESLGFQAHSVVMRREIR